MVRLLPALIRVARVQFVLISVVGFVAGYHATGAVNGWIMFGGICVHLFGKVADGFLNAYSDREEDRINLPAYAAEVERIGYDTCKRLAVGLYGICGVMALAGLIYYPVPTLLGLVGGLAPAITYSVGPRFKRHSFVSPLLIFLWAAVPLLIGWSTAQGADIPGEVWWAFLLLGGFMAVNRITRYLNDVAGDRQAGVATLYTGLVVSPNSRLWLAVQSSPYLLTAVLVAGGAIPLRYLWLMLLWPGALLMVALLCKAQTPAEQGAVWDWATIQCTLTHVAVLLAFHPDGLTAGLAAAVVLARLALSEWGLDYRAQLPLGRLLATMLQTLTR